MSREEVASQLRLQVRQIAALEEDDYAALPGQTFVSGYLRSYARLLELPEESFTGVVAVKSEPPPLVSTSASRRQASSRDWFTRLVTFLIIGVIAVSVVMWWLAQHRAVPPQATVSSPAVVEQGGELKLTLPEAPSQPEEDATTAPAEPPTEAASAPEKVAAPENEAGAAAEQPVQETPVQGSEAEPVAPPPLTDAMPQSKLELRYEADSWTEVSDNAGRQLTYGLIKAGQVLLLRGEAPFRVFLGYAPGVQVYYNDALFDHTPFQRRDVARFRIGRAEHNHPGSR